MLLISLKFSNDLSDMRKLQIKLWMEQNIEYQFRIKEDLISLSTRAGRIVDVCY